MDPLNPLYAVDPALALALDAIQGKRDDRSPSPPPAVATWPPGQPGEEIVAANTVITPSFSAPVSFRDVPLTASARPKARGLFRQWWEEFKSWLT